MARILITGGCGFIGSSVVRMAVQSNQHSVLNIDSLTYAASEESVASLNVNPNYDFKKIDICDFDLVLEAIVTFQPQIIIHLAAETHVDNSISAPKVFLTTNLLGTGNLLEAVTAYFNTLNSIQKSEFRFLNVSTDEVFGDLGYEKSLFTEKSKYNPSSPYSASKAGADHLVRAWHRTFGIPTIITHCTNNYGPFQYPEKLIPKVIFNALNGRRIPIYGRGNQVRDWIFVDDHASALLLLSHYGKPGDSYNIGSNQTISNLELVYLILDELKNAFKSPEGISQDYRELISFVDDRPGHDQKYALDCGKILSFCDWRPRHSLKNGIRETVKWYIGNQTWLSKTRKSA